METNYVHNEMSPSMLDVLLLNLQRSNMKIHIYRVMYVGEHEQSFKMLEEHFKETISTANVDQRDEFLNGLLLFYSKYFIAILEGSEESIFRHLDILLDEKSNITLKKIKILIMLRVNQRTLTKSWQALPLNDLQELTVERQIRSLEVWQEARVCVAKLHRLAGVLASREANMGGPLSDRSLLPEPAVLAMLVDNSLLLSVEEIRRRAISPESALQHDDLVWPPDDPLS